MAQPRRAATALTPFHRRRRTQPGDFVDEAIAFEFRSVLAGSIRHSEGLALCGRGAACPG